MNKHFDNIYCINLDRRPDRWSEVSEETSKHNLIVERVSAIDGNPNNIQTNNGVSDGDVGCTLTHCKILQDAIDKNYTKILVLEDDVVFSDDLNNLFDEYLGMVPDDWDMIYLGGNHINEPIYINEHVYRVTHTYTTHAYAIKRKVFSEVLELQKNAKKQVDVYYSDLQKTLNCYVIKPHLAWQRDSFSDIQNRFMSYPFLK